jgi:CRISPR-associated exonuclease Cas4
MSNPVEKLKKTARNPDCHLFRVTGVMMQYYAVCKRELWFYLQDVDIDKENKHIHRGTRVDETAFAERRESVHLGMIVPDLLENGRVAEIKPSSDGPEAGRELQLYYYLWYFKHILGTEREGVLIYPTENKRETVTLTGSDEDRVEDVIEDIYELREQASPPPLEEKPFCTACAYQDFCWV